MKVTGPDLSKYGVMVTGNKTGSVAELTEKLKI